MRRRLDLIVARAIWAFALAVCLSPAAVLAQSAYGDLGGSTSRLVYYAETYSPGNGPYEEARVEAWILGDPAGASWYQDYLSAWVQVEWEDDFCGEYTGESNHWWIISYYWHNVIQGYQDDYEVPGC